MCAAHLARSSNKMQPASVENIDQIDTCCCCCPILAYM